MDNKPSMEKFKVLILDFDGVVIESVGIKDEAFRTLFQGYPDHIDQIMDYHFASNAVIRFEQFEYITRNILKEEYSPWVEDELSRQFSEIVFQGIVTCPFVQGAIEFLDHFSVLVPVYIASVSPVDELNRILEARGIAHYFKKVYASPWIKTDAFADILRTEGLDSRDAVFVGDMPEDYYSARQADIFFIGRKSRAEFPNKGIPVFDDLVGIQQFLTVPTI